MRAPTTFPSLAIAVLAIGCGSAASEPAPRPDPEPVLASPPPNPPEPSPPPAHGIRRISLSSSNRCSDEPQRYESSLRWDGCFETEDEGHPDGSSTLRTLCTGCVPASTVAPLFARVAAGLDDGVAEPSPEPDCFRRDGRVVRADGTHTELEAATLDAVRHEIGTLIPPRAQRACVERSE